MSKKCKLYVFVSDAYNFYYSCANFLEITDRQKVFNFLHKLGPALFLIRISFDIKLELDE